jgi:ubiquinone/menaquinone biosynthesis C-methylase UbiE
MSNKAVHESHIWQSDDVAEKYHQTEIVTRVFADLLIQKTGIANHEGDIRVLDLACGTGAVAASLYAALPREKWDRVKVVGGDNSEAMIAYLRKKGEREGWRGLEAVILDGAVGFCAFSSALPLPSERNKESNRNIKMPYGVSLN